MNCDPSFLANAARCFSRCSADLSALKTYLLCRVASHGFGGCVGYDEPANFQWTFSPSTGNARWDAPPAGVSATQLWTSTDNITFALANTTAAPGQSTTAAAPSFPFYAKARFIDAQGNVGTFTSPQRVPSGRDWGYRVVNNGGAAPSTADKNAVDGWVTGLVLDNLLSSIYTAGFMFSDLTACRTPVFYQFGTGLWANTAFVAGDRTIDGLVGNGTTKFLNLGFSPRDVQLSAFNNPSTRFGLDFYSFTLGTPKGTEVGAADADYNTACALYVQFSDGFTYGDLPYAAGFGRSNVAGAVGPGFGSANRRLGNPNGLMALYKYTHAAGLLEFAARADIVAQVVSTNNFYAWALDQPVPFFSDKRGSFVAVRDGFLWQELAHYSVHIQDALIAHGGGFI